MSNEKPSVSPSALAVMMPAATYTATWKIEARPMPMTLPASSCHGRTEASRISMTREDFSSTTPWATAMPPPKMPR